LAKGAGMIEPNMATMLSFLLTDAAVDRRSLAGCLRRATEKSFNAITVDGCMSTNDTVIILANGRAGNRTLRAGSDGLLRFDEAVLSVVTELATAIVRDGEGATKIIELTVEGAGSAGDAKKIAFAVGRSNLVKTAFFGKDPNWGRVYAAVGASGVPVKEEELEIYFGGIPIFKRGRGIEKADRPLLEVMERDSVAVLVRVGSGPGSFTVFAADLTHDYVTINAHYHT
ncbi:MAG TPA: bifunctional ornithine acetyltransferase/N-acetylglutamate synthase, partial [Syntrophales bacterium]|nr:bifunctional ornithine acetyltransferase/N-acetylglutamate synthase [Syntrophales bacterium]